MAIGFGSSEGSSPADPPFAQLGGETSGGWQDKLKAAGAGAFNAIAPDYMKSAVAGVGDMKAFQKRRDAKRSSQNEGLAGGQRQMIRDKAKQLLESKGGSMGGVE